MHTPDAWLLQIYRMTDATAQILTAGLLAGIDDLAVESTADADDHYVIVESTDADQARSVSDVVSAVDPGARLLHASTSASGRRAA